MPVFCPHCGTQNPDGNAFCQACGQSLAGITQPASPGGLPPATGGPPAGVPPSLPPAGGPPAGVPPGLPPGGSPLGGGPPPGPPPQYGAPPPYSAPYPATTGVAVPPAHRLPLVAIVGGIIGAVILLALAAVVVNAAFNKPNPTPVPPPTQAPTVLPTTAPTVPPTTLPQPTPTSGPQTTTTPGTTPTPPPQETPTTISGPVNFSTNTWAANIPSSWTKVKSDNTSATFRDGSGAGIVIIDSFRLKTPTTLQGAINAITASVQKDAPDEKDCGNGASKATLGTPPVPGAIFVLCYNFTPQGGSAFPAADEYFVGISTAGDTAFEVNLFGRTDKNKTLVEDALPIIKSIRWKLATP